MSTPFRYRYVGPSTRPVEVFGRLVRRTDSRHTSVTVRGEVREVPDVLELPASAVDHARRLEDSPIYERVSGSRKPPEPDPEPASTDADDAADSGEENA